MSVRVPLKICGPLRQSIAGVSCGHSYTSRCRQGSQLDARAISLKLKKLPGNSMSYCETMIWRFTELAQEALDNLDRNRFAAGIVLTRAAVEPPQGSGLPVRGRIHR